MTGSMLFEYAVKWSNLTFPIASVFLIQSTVIILIGLSVKYALRNQSAVLQSFILRVCLIAVFVAPASSYFYRTAGLKGFNIPAAYKENVRNVYTPLREVAPLQEQSSEVQNSTVPKRSNSLVKNVPLVSQEIAGEQSTVESIPKNSQTNNSQISLTPEKRTSSLTPGINGSTNVDNYDSQTPVSKGNVHSTVWIFLAVLYILFPMAWTVFSLFKAIKVLTGVFYIKYICHLATNAEPDDYERCGIFAREFGIKTPVILISPYVKSTLLTGFFRPTILVPAGGNKSAMSSNEVLVHELAHLKRRDYLWNQLGQIGKIILPLQPLLKLLTRQIEELSDYVCDEYVIKHLDNRHTYASQLLHMIQSIKSHHPEFTPGIGIITTKSQLRKRIERILDRSRALSMKTRIREVFSVSVLFLTTIILTGFVNFKEQPQQSGNDRTKVISHTVLALLDPPEQTTYTFTAISPDGAESERTDARIASNEKNVSDSNEKHMQKDIMPAGDSLESPDFKPLEQSAAELSTVSHFETSVEDVSERTDDIHETSDAGNIIPVHRPGTEHADYIQSIEKEPLILKAVQNIFEDNTSEVPSGSMFNANQGGIKISGFRDNRIKLPVAKAVNVVIKEDYENFDLKNEESRKEYNVYKSLDKSKNEPAWSPDGKWIAFTDNNRIWIVSPSGGEPKLVYENKYDGFSIGGIKSICFTPDGSELIFKKDIYDINRGSEVNIYETNKYNEDSENKISKTRVAIFENPIPNIESVNISTGEHRIIAENGYSCSLSHNGRYLCYINWSLHYNKLFKVKSTSHGVPILLDLETGERTELSVGDDNYYGKPTFSPDDSEVVIPILHMDEPDEFYRFTIESGKTEKLAVNIETGNLGKSISSPEYSPNGQWILYTDLTRSADSPDKQLILYSTLTGERFGYFENPQAKNSMGKWSPDGKQICYLVEDNDGNYIYISDFDSRRYDLAKPAFEETAPLEFSIKQNYPNPFNLSTTIEYSLPEKGVVNLAIYNSMGQRVRELVSDNMEPGQYSAVWDGCDENGNTVASGIYISRLIMGNSIQSSKMTLVK